MDPSPQPPSPNDPDRRTFFSRCSSLTMAGGLLAGYGVFAGMAVRFLYPSHGRKMASVFVGEVASIKVNEVRHLRTPAGQEVTLTRRKEDGTADDFLALSTTCPHLGCQVHWEGQNNRFFCPCHNGAFDPQGNPTEGPPADAGTPLPHFPVTITNSLVFIEVPAEVLG
jgi:cytochrome b6-f complex iron-sulfur subunit